MIRSFHRLSKLVPSSSQKNINGSFINSGRRLMSTDDSHDDFKPKKKNVPTELDEVLKLIADQVKENDIMLYMKGSPNKPSCGFSRQAVQILHNLGADFSSVDVIQYPTIRDAIKVYSDWPTIPQLYIKGQFIGGCDIMTTMYKSGELDQLLKEKKLIS